MPREDEEIFWDENMGRWMPAPPPTPVATPPPGAYSPLGGAPRPEDTDPGFVTTEPYVKPGAKWWEGDYRGGANWSYNPYQEGTDLWRARQIELDRRLRQGGGGGGGGSFSPGGGLTTIATNPALGGAWAGQAAGWTPQAYQNNQGILQFDDRDFETLTPEARPFVDTLLRTRGWKPTGVMGQFGATRYQYSGSEKPQNIWFNPELFSGLPSQVGGQVAGLFRKKGWTT
jgi:hypothetical protein